MTLQVPPSYRYEPSSQLVYDTKTSVQIDMGLHRGRVNYSAIIPGGKLYFRDKTAAYSLDIYEYPTFNLKTYLVYMSVILSQSPELSISCDASMVKSLDLAQEIVNICGSARLK